MLTNSSGLQWNQSAAGWTASLAHCSCFVFAVVVVIGCGNCGLWHISRSTAKRLEAVSALRARFCVCMHITSLRQYLVCAALHLRMWKLNLIFCCCFLYSNWSSNRLGLSRNKVETPSRHRHTYTHPQHQSSSVYRWCLPQISLHLPNLCIFPMLSYVRNQWRSHSCICVCEIAENCRCLQWCVGQLAEPVFDLLVV